MTRRTPLHGPRLRGQHGAVAIEFAFLFAIFFVALYGAITYALVMVVQQALTQAAAEGARAAVSKVDPLRFTTETLRRNEQTRLARIAVEGALSWLPAAARNRILETGIATAWSIKNVVIQTGAQPQTLPMSTITVTVTYPDYASAPLMPILKMPGYGPVPSVPQNLVGKATATP